MPFARFASALLVSAVSFAADSIPGNPGGLIVHEWGTFTSVAAADGSSIPWTILADDGDLPCFVARPNLLTKFTTQSRVRMETPVLYFYTQHAAKLSVGVDFPEGQITEWYPPATLSDSRRRLDWNSVEVSPGAAEDFPRSAARSHYYAARSTDAAPLRVGDRPEKFLFYRGLGNFEVPILPTFAADGAVELGKRIPAILFENRGGRIGYRIATGARIAPPELTGSFDDLRDRLTGMLVEAGLYPKEASAMVETWRDSWFEEGMRLLYLVPRARVDQLLPLQIDPPPQAVERVFVGRIELISPAIRETIGTAVAARDGATLRRYGRFLNAFASEIVNPADLRAGQFLASLRADPPRETACVQ